MQGDCNWVQLDLGPHMLFQPTGFTLYHSDAFRPWRFEASADAKEWTLLHTVDNTRRPPCRVLTEHVTTLFFCRYVRIALVAEGPTQRYAPTLDIRAVELVV